MGEILPPSPPHLADTRAPSDLFASWGGNSGDNWGGGYGGPPFLLLTCAKLVDYLSTVSHPTHFKIFEMVVLEIFKALYVALSENWPVLSRSPIGRWGGGQMGVRVGMLP